MAASCLGKCVPHAESRDTVASKASLNVFFMGEILVWVLTIIRNICDKKKACAHGRIGRDTGD